MKTWVDFFHIRLKILTLLTFFSAWLIWYQTQYLNLTQSDKLIIKRYVIMIQTSFGTFKFGGKWERSAYTSNHWLEANDWRIGLSIYLLRRGGKTYLDLLLLLLLLLLMCTGVDRVPSRRSKNGSRATCNPSNELPIGVQLGLIESRICCKVSASCSKNWVCSLLPTYV